MVLDSCAWQLPWLKKKWDKLSSQSAGGAKAREAAAPTKATRAHKKKATMSSVPGATRVGAAHALASAYNT